MEILKFKTTINCSGCLAKVTPFLNDENAIEKWDVNIDTPEKTLTVETNEADGDKIIEAVKKAGFQIEKMSGR
ncbi:heavy-metal-associated domain-containing protein [Aurantibacillus circumpalustris]|uniref:heavy-metal-associated domain-containing protein n=1 Tax=Aurantibacillus circumpalustris TaxID=3036359 RepID=UPI00295BCF9C|nr:heavy-metal-associated domain-containing protein [Aurantibacillus circumpalustris]